MASSSSAAKRQGGVIESCDPDRQRWFGTLETDDTYQSCVRNSEAGITKEFLHATLSNPDVVYFVIPSSSGISFALLRRLQHSATVDVICTAPGTKGDGKRLMKGMFAYLRTKKIPQIRLFAVPARVLYFHKQHGFSIGHTLKQVAEQKECKELNKRASQLAAKYTDIRTVSNVTSNPEVMALLQDLIRADMTRAHFVNGSAANVRVATDDRDGYAMIREVSLSPSKRKPPCPTHGHD